MAKNEEPKLIVPKGVILMVYPLNGNEPQNSNTRRLPLEGNYNFEMREITEKGMDWDVTREWVTFVMQGRLYGIAPEDMARVEHLPNGDYRIKTE